MILDLYSKIKKLNLEDLENLKEIKKEIISVILIIIICIFILINLFDILNNNVLGGIEYRILNNILKSLIFLVPGIISVYKLFYEKESYSLEEYKKIQIKKEKNESLIKIIQGILFIFLAIRLYYFYKPTNAEKSMAILIKYLREKNILDSNIYNKLKTLKPHNINKVKL